MQEQHSIKYDENAKLSDEQIRHFSTGHLRRALDGLRPYLVDPLRYGADVLHR
jgi:hypothetical protein